MITAKLFMNGSSQAVRLPKEFRFEESEVLIKKVGDVVMLIPKDRWKEIFTNAVENYPSDAIPERISQIQQRESVF
jgi:antitoxin VapB